jgi:ribose 5-phosphate isomerase B
MDKETIWIGNDHGGYDLKQNIVNHLTQSGYAVRDVGSDSDQIVRYPYFAAEVAGAISKGEINRGILICSTGIGMSIIANKFPNVRASMCTNVHMAHMTRAHNDSNVLCLGGKITPEIEAVRMVDEWLNTPYEGGRHDISLGLVSEAEHSLVSTGCWIPTAPKTVT